MKTLIIGGGAAGASCAARLRRNDEKAEITVLEQSDEISIANCGLPYYIGNVINSEETMHVSDVNKFRNWFNINVLLNTKAVSIDRNNRTVKTADNQEFSYDRLVIATGATPFVPPFEGLNKDKTFTLRTLSDANSIKNYIKEHEVSKAVVVGAGFIGVEMAENLCELGIRTTIVELSSHIMPNVDIEVATVAQNKLKEKGIEIILNDGVKAFSDDKVILTSGNTVDFDIVIMSIGVMPQIELAKEAGLEVSRGIVVDSTLKTSDEYIYAAGDNVEITDFTTGSKALIPLAGPANRQGRIIADNICGKTETYKNTQGSSVVKIFELTLAAVGANEDRLKKLNIPYLKTFIYSNSHAGYYPGAKQILYKMLFTKEGRILGLQAIGEEGVEKRVDVVATVMRLNGSVHDLLDAELCYAPPFNSAKDAVNILGMNALNIIEGKVRMAFPEDLKDSYLIDVRPKAVFMNETIDGAVNIPITDIRNRLDEIPRDRKVVMFCNTGYTSYVASRIVNQNGFENVYSFGGGIVFFKSQQNFLNSNNS